MRRPGDRFDAKKIRDVDALHFLMPVIYPGRTANEGYIKETIDLTETMKFLEKKNEGNDGYHYTFFQLMVTAALKILVLRPQLNRFIKSGSMYQRNHISAAFTVKRKFDDNGDEGLAFIKGFRVDTLDTIHQKMYDQIYQARKGDGGDAVDSTNLLRKFGFIGKLILRLVVFLEKRNIVIPALTVGDPGYSSVFLSNLGSIGMRAGYHHLSNWGTNSVFIVIGQIKKRPFYDENGKVEMKMSVDMGLTVDERIADGYYFSKSVRLLKFLLEHPEELEKRLEEKPKKLKEK